MDSSILFDSYCYDMWCIWISLPQDATGLPASSPCPTHKAPPISSESNHHNPSVPPPLGPSHISYIQQEYIMTAFCVWKVIFPLERTQDKSSLHNNAIAETFATYDPFSMFLWSSHASGFPIYTHPITRGPQRPALVGSHFFWHPSTWHRTLVPVPHWIVCT